MSNKNTFFVIELLEWGKTVERDLPWKSTNDPYKIWLSEIILQQTRVDQGRPYYLKFIEKYPTIFDMANASEDEIMGLWKGLGYYSRARNLHTTSKIIVTQFGGEFPNDFKTILSLKGIGQYTASAILSFSFNAPFAVLDGNVIRVLSRYFGITQAVDSTETLKKLQSLASKLLPKDKSAIYNQAIMDFGATFCIPKSPNCNQCIFKEKCSAYKKSLVAEIPFKAKKTKKTERFFHFLVIKDEKVILMQKRSGKDIWQGLFQLPLIEVKTKPQSKMSSNFINNTIFSKSTNIKFIKKLTQKLTHQTINGYFWDINLDTNSLTETDYVWIEYEQLKKIGLPRIIDLFLTENLLSLK